MCLQPAVGCDVGEHVADRACVGMRVFVGDEDGDAHVTHRGKLEQTRVKEPRGNRRKARKKTTPCRRVLTFVARLALRYGDTVRHRIDGVEQQHIMGIAGPCMVATVARSLVHRQRYTTSRS
jgi:hypothetical protein